MMRSNFDEEEEEPRSKSEYELLREKNIRERDAFFSAFEDTDEYREAMEGLEDYREYIESQNNEVNQSKPSRKRKRTLDGEEAFRCKAQIPLERRRSCRLASRDPNSDDVVFDYKEEDDDNDIDSLEKVIRPPKKKPKPIPQCIKPLAVEDVTEQMIQKIAQSATKKKYSTDGTTCHQCRQKTTDTKTICRSGHCVGVNGQFCGPCLRNRYGEEVAAALMDPNWSCPYCRGLCNCSFCRARAGKRPTGILAPMALQRGFKSVKHFLDDLKGYGDRPNEKCKTEENENQNNDNENKDEDHNEEDENEKNEDERQNNNENKQDETKEIKDHNEEDENDLNIRNSSLNEYIVKEETPIDLKNSITKGDNKEDIETSITETLNESMKNESSKKDELTTDNKETNPNSDCLESDNKQQRSKFEKKFVMKLKIAPPKKLLKDLQEEPKKDHENAIPKHVELENVRTVTVQNVVEGKSERCIFKLPQLPMSNCSLYKKIEYPTFLSTDISSIPNTFVDLSIAIKATKNTLRKTVLKQRSEISTSWCMKERIINSSKTVEQTPKRDSETEKNEWLPFNGQIKYSRNKSDVNGNRDSESHNKENLDD